MSIQPIPPTSAPTTAGQLVSRAYQNDQALAARATSSEARLLSLENRAGPSGMLVRSVNGVTADLQGDIEIEAGGVGAGITPDPDYPGYYVIGEGGGGPVDYPPTITLGVSANGLDVTATFTASDPEGAPVAVHIDWGDGNATTLATSPAAHTYAAPGEYTITATATAGGKTGTDTAHVEVAQVNAPGAYSAAVLADDPVVYVPFTEEAAPFVDVQGSVSLTSEGVAPAVPGGIPLGSLPRSAAFSVSEGLDAATYSLGAIPAIGSAASVEFVVRPWQLGGRSFITGLTVRTDNDGRVVIWNGSGWSQTATGAVATGGVITHVVVTWTATLALVYINGVEALSEPGTYDPGAVSSWTVGGPVPASTTANFRGYLAGVAFYDRAITQAEAADHFAALGIGA